MPDKAQINYTNVAAAVFGQVWAIQPAKLQALVEVIRGRICAGEALPPAGYEARTKRPIQRVEGSVAVIGLTGILAQRMNLIQDSSGGTSTDQFGAALAGAVNDDSIGAIVLDVDSPGGSVYGVVELADRVFKARGRKPIIAVANSLAASAAYWVASAADRLVVTPGGEVGSIGVLAVHTEYSKAEEAIGVKTSLIYAGEYKTEGNPHEPLTDSARTAIQSRVDQYYAMFTSAVARQRGVAAKAVREGFGQGRVVGAEDAVAAGMADQIGTLDEVIASLRGAQKASGRSRAQVQNELTIAKCRQPLTR